MEHKATGKHIEYWSKGIVLDPALVLQKAITIWDSTWNLSHEVVPKNMQQLLDRRRNPSIVDAANVRRMIDGGKPSITDSSNVLMVDDDGGDCILIFTSGPTTEAANCSRGYASLTWRRNIKVHLYPPRVEWRRANRHTCYLAHYNFWKKKNNWIFYTPKESLQSFQHFTGKRKQTITICKTLFIFITHLLNFILPVTMRVNGNPTWQQFNMLYNSLEPKIV